jgi:hypothetical protein
LLKTLALALPCEDAEKFKFFSHLPSPVKAKLAFYQVYAWLLPSLGRTRKTLKIVYFGVIPCALFHSNLNQKNLKEIIKKFVEK